MGKRIKHELRYDGATLEQVHAMLADPAFREEVCEYQRYPRRTVTIVPAGAGMTVKVDQHRPADHVPSFARKLVGDEINILQEEEWSSPVAGRLTVTIPGKPGEMKGTIALVADATGVTETVDVEAKVSIPLIGGKLEGFIGDMLLKALKAENKVGTAWLDR
ncbi:DUF2505 domain-containing protein [Marmoricola sp. RAF53]|uniref:DUF2505 domain-containing protein n=1 Tax=Marmoricola sp. RAF53 TaxID=3233059 RepID=UPI003F95CA2C